MAQNGFLEYKNKEEKQLRYEVQIAFPENEDLHKDKQKRVGSG